MTRMRKITAFVAERELEGAQAFTGKGVTETIREALRELAHQRACQELLALRGKVHLERDSGVTLEELREDKTYERPAPDGPA